MFCAFHFSSKRSRVEIDLEIGDVDARERVARDVERRVHAQTLRLTDARSSVSESFNTPRLEFQRGSQWARSPMHNRWTSHGTWTHRVSLIRQFERSANSRWLA